MKVKELVELLLTFDQDSPIILQSDSEGNSYSPLDGAESSLYAEEMPRFGTCVSEDELEDYPDAISCVVLWPVN